MWVLPVAEGGQVAPARMPVSPWPRCVPGKQQILAGAVAVALIIIFLLPFLLR